MKIVHLSYLSALAVACATGCSGTDLAATERDETATSALSSGGATAVVSKVTDAGASYTAEVTITNNSNEPLYNWQIAVDFHTGAFIANSVVGADATIVGGKPVFTAGLTSGRIDPGHNYVFTFKGTTAGTSHVPTVTTLDGLAPGSVNAGNPADGVDMTARAAASAALNVARKYVDDKLPNSPADIHYSIYTDLIWDSHSYRLAADNKTIEFDPNIPGYRFIPNSAKAELAFAQLDPAVASYMTTGLASCFAQVNYDMVYGIAAGFLAGLKFPGGTSGQRTNSNRTVDYYTTTVVPVNGTMEIKMVETSTTDKWFGLLSYFFERTYATSQDALIAKYNSQGAEASCSPFNGPGGSSNPYLVISLNGAQVPAHYNTPSPTDCSHGCTSTIVIDPVPYAEPGTYYDANNKLVGAQSNPFGLVNTTLYADPAHATQWASRTANGTQEWGTFSSATVLFGTTKYKYVKQF